MSDLPADRLALARSLAGLPAKRRVDALLEAKDPRALVRSLPAEDLYFTIKEVGLDDAAELVQLASPTQFRAFVDLDCWRRDTYQPRALLPWLRAAEDGEDGLQRKLASLDLEVVELLLRETVDVWDLEEDPDREPEGHPWRSPEGRYAVDFRAEGEDLSTLRRVVESYYQKDPLQAVRFLEAVRWELPSELEETALRWRSGRLADMGFPELEQALKLYAYVDPEAPVTGEFSAPAEPPGFFLQALAGGERFLDKVLARLTADDLGRIDRELVGVLNGALVADAVDVGHLEEVRRALLGARDHLSLGLEHASGADPERARELLLSAPVSRIFQVASGLTLKRKFRADRIYASGRAGLPGARPRAWLDEPLGATLDGLRRKRPQLNAALTGGSGHRPFRDRADLAATDAALAKAEALVALLGRAGPDPALIEPVAREARGPEFAGARLSEALLHLALQGRGAPVAKPAVLDRPALEAALAWALTEAGEPSEALTRAVRQSLEGAAQSEAEREVARELADYVLQRAREGLAPLRAPGGADPKLLAAVPAFVLWG